MKNTIILLFIILGATSCSDYLDIIPDNIATVDNAFTNRNNAKSFLYTCYSYLPNDGSPNNNPAFLGGDEMWVQPKGPELSTFFGGTNGVDIGLGFQNANSPLCDYWTGDNSGKNLWIGVRDCNIFLDNIDKVTDLNDWEKKIWVAEVKFLKAYYHYYLYRMYGPIPIIDKNLPISSSPEEVKLERKPESEVVQYIINLIDELVDDLPSKIDFETTELGRATQPIALAVKAKTLVLSASPIFNRSGFYSDLVDAGGNQLIDDTDNPEKWTKAKQAVEEAIAKCHEVGMELYEYNESVNISDSTRLKMNIRGSVTDRWNSELVWGQTFRGATDHLQRISQARFNASQVGNHSVRNLLGATMRMVELYYTANGVPINEDNSWNYEDRFEVSTVSADDRYYLKEGYETANLNIGREPRFYASLGFDGSIWYGQGRYDDDDPYHLEMKARQFAGGAAGEKICITGYLTKKWVHVDNVIGSGSDYSTEFVPFPSIRLADLYLLHAETANESGANATEVFQYLDMVRERAGLDKVVDAWQAHSNNPTKPQSQDGRRDIIKNERMIELAFEGHRFWDLRRWLDAETVMSSPIRTWNLKESTSSGYYKVISIFDKKFYRREYLWPIKRDELLVNNKLVQNPGWN